MDYIRIKILLINLAILTSCAKDVHPPPCDDCRVHTANENMESQERTRQLLREIESLIANKSCDSDDDCKLIGIGYSLCGHPVAFYAYSSQNVDLSLVDEKARELRDLQEKDSPNDTAGICGFKGPPPPACLKDDQEEKRCMLPGYSP